MTSNTAQQALVLVLGPAALARDLAQALDLAQVRVQVQVQVRAPAPARAADDARNVQLGRTCHDAARDSTTCFSVAVSLERTGM